MTQLQSVGLMISIWPTLSRDGSSVNGENSMVAGCMSCWGTNQGQARSMVVCCHILEMCPNAKSYGFHDYIVSCTDIKSCFDIRGYVSWPPCGYDQWQFHGHPSRMFPWLGIVQRSHEHTGRSGRLGPTGLFDVLDLQKQHKPSWLLLEKG